MRRIFLLIPALALAIAACGGGDEEGSKTDKAQRPATTETTATQTDTTGTTETEGTTTERPDPKARDVSLAVSSLVEAVEQTDVPRACQLLGQSPRGSGPAAIQGCAEDAGVTLDRLPSTDEFTIQSVKVSNGTAVVRLPGRSIVRLKRSGSRWVVVDYVPPKLGQP